MKFFTIISLASVCFAVALLIIVGCRLAPAIDDQAIEQHWVAVRHHKYFLENPDNYKPDPATGLGVASPPDVLPSLAALVSAGELEHVDLVFPTVLYTRQARLVWVRWAEGQKDVWYTTGKRQYGDYQPAGDPPFHIEIWFERSAKPKVQQLIKDLEALPEEGTCPPAAVAPGRAMPVVE